MPEISIGANFSQQSSPTELKPESRFRVCIGLAGDDISGQENANDNRNGIFFPNGGSLVAAAVLELL